ncbi:MAG: RAMP superfamily CRISPR-associated protein [Candidatus Bathyarchaeota archaeon]|nr:RAMP superfamily CRISPR-associated protein [Candidatus Bathyarchaeota archaeon]
MSVLCYKLSGILKAEAPLHIGSGLRTGTIKKTKAYIPGSALRGAVGTSIIKIVCRLDRPLLNHEECRYFNECVYATLFGEEFGKASHILFRYCYPTHVKCGGTYLPAPMNLYECKNPQCKRLYRSFYPPAKCVCGDELKLYSGFQCSCCGEVYKSPIVFSRFTSTAVERWSSSVATVHVDGNEVGTLHTTETIAKGSRFSFEIVVSGKVGSYIDELESVMLHGLADEGVGGGKSRGLGKVSIESIKIEEVTEDVVKKAAEDIDTRSFVVRLVSPMLLEGQILNDKSLLEGCRRSYSFLFHEGKPKLSEVKLKATRVDSEIFCGWSLKMQKRRSLEPAVSAGSVFHFESDTNDDVLALSLAALEFLAIGNYKPHGCGQVKIEKYQ